MTSFIRVRSRRNRLSRLHAADRARDRKADETAETKPLVFKFPYGRHKGQPITEVPSNYLEWMVREKHTLAKRARRELQRRRKSRKQGSTL